MFYEIDILNVGNGDAIIISFFDNPQKKYTVVIDGGNPEDGIKVVNHIRNLNITYIDLVISTHPDKDHLGGLFEVISQIQVFSVWIHDPLQHLNNFRWLLDSAKQQKKADKLVEAFEYSIKFINLLDYLKINRLEPFPPRQFGPIFVAGPTKEYYEKLLLGFRDVESLVSNDLKENNVLNDILDYIAEQNGTDSTLDENSETSNENNSSVILLGIFDGKKHLFTGDAGVQALISACLTYNLSNLFWLDVPHHGSKRNLSQSLVDFFRPSLSCISSDGSRKHPSRAVVNALKRYGTVCSTHNGNLLFHNWLNALRVGYGPIIPL